MESKLFRKVALDRLSSPEQLDEMMRITNPRGWIALAAIGALLAALFLWGLFGNVPLVVTGEGLLTRGGGLITVTASAAGTVTLLVDEGALTQKDQTLAVVGTTKAAAAVTGRVLRLFVEEGAEVAAGTPLLEMESTDDASNPLEAVVFVPPAEGARIAVGMTVQISPVTVRREENGYMLGTVKAISESPASAARITRLTGDPDFAASVTTGGSPTEIRVTLTLDGTTPSGYRWSSSQGPDFKLQSGTFTNATVVIGDRRPLSLIFGYLPFFASLTADF
ncbi:MAG TPA: NHLP bacteriocin system secretion protein [Aggregatilineales bacterium]|nr:NHLP bacteriocin system secretion protein [Anaerolineales bacterium]HRE48339.1 NHLP bacteriocin system secretion protein [Aggregatilineales bacterium]